MKKAGKTVVNVVYFISLGGVLIVGALGVIYEIIGPAKYEHMLSAMGISNGLECTWLVGLIMLFLFAAASFIKKLTFKAK